MSDDTMPNGVMRDLCFEAAYLTIAPPTSIPFGIVRGSACSAKLNQHDPYQYLRDVLERLPTQPASRLDELLPHCWKAAPLKRV